MAQPWPPSPLESSDESSRESSPAKFASLPAKRHNASVASQGDSSRRPLGKRSVNGNNARRAPPNVLPAPPAQMHPGFHPFYQTAMMPQFAMGVGPGFGTGMAMGQIRKAPPRPPSSNRPPSSAPPFLPPCSKRITPRASAAYRRDPTIPRNAGGRGGRRSQEVHLVHSPAASHSWAFATILSTNSGSVMSATGARRMNCTTHVRPAGR